jgi:LuxR family quorum sensing-dependent transcriptional regulator
MASSAAAIRLEKLIGDDVSRVGARASLTQREEGLGVETVRSHFKKAETKLGTRNRTHTVAEAMRQLLII